MSRVRATPHARRLLTARADTQSQAAMRARHLNTSDIAAVLGLHEHEQPSRTPAHVWHDKRGDLLPEAPSPELAWARQLAPIIAEQWCQANAGAATRHGGYVVNTVRRLDGDEWMGATVPRLVSSCPDGRGPCSLMVRVRGSFAAAGWGVDPPDAVIAEALWSAEVCGHSHTHVAVLIGGNDYRQYTVWRYRHTDLARQIVADAERFWREHVLADERPLVHGAAAARIDLYSRLLPQRAGAREVTDEELPAVLEAIALRERGRLAIKKLTAEHYDEGKARLLELLGGHQALVYRGEVLASVSTGAGKPRVDLKELARKHPKAYRACVQATTQDRLSIGTGRKLGSGSPTGLLVGETAQVHS